MVEQSPNRKMSQKVKGKYRETKALGRKHLSPHSIAMMIPNMVTLGSLTLGLSSIRFAYLGKFEWAVGAVLVAAILDGMDGALARMLKAESIFGAELDSLADFLGFGIAPALIMYMLVFQNLGGIGWGIVLIYAIALALRLARFNTLSIKASLNKTVPKDWQKLFNMGVPAPSAAGLMLWPLILSFIFESTHFLNPIFITINTLAAAVLAVSKLPTFSPKGIKISPEYNLIALLVGAFFIVLLATHPWEVCGILGFMTYATIPLSYRVYQNKLNNKAINE